MPLLPGFRKTEQKMLFRMQKLLTLPIHSKNTQTRRNRKIHATNKRKRLFPPDSVIGFPSDEESGSKKFKKALDKPFGA